MGLRTPALSQRIAVGTPAGRLVGAASDDPAWRTATALWTFVKPGAGDIRHLTVYRGFKQLARRSLSIAMGLAADGLSCPP